MEFNNFRGMVYGGALGDALGAPHEFRYSKPVYNGKLCFKSEIRNRGTVYLNVGQVTDDTEMSMCIANMLIKNDGIYNIEDTINEYIRWVNSGTHTMGRNTRQLFYGIKTMSGYLRRYDAKFKTNEEFNLSAENAQSNGALMRCGLLSLFMSRDIEQYKYIIKQDCYLTNPNVIALNCNIILTSAIYYAMCKIPMEEIFKKCQTIIDNDVVLEYYNKALNGEVINVKNNKGWCMYGMYLAFYALKHTSSYKEGIDYIIKQGGDTDTNACIGGYLLGAYYGFDEMSKDKITYENIIIMYSAQTDRPYYLNSKYLNITNLKKIWNSIN